MALLLPFVPKAQNLVPNESFEQYNNCPTGLASIPYTAGYNYFPTVTNWTTPVKNSTPDYFHTCAPAGSGLKVPYSQFGYQMPYSGNAYAGIIAWEGQVFNGAMTFDYREYLQTRLSHPLEAGKNYCISFRVSPSINTAFTINYVWMDEVGINLSPQRPTDTQNYYLSLPYHLRNPAGSYLTDTAGWREVRGTYTATGGEEWLTLGCFRNNGTLPPVYTQAYPPTPNPVNSYRSYLYIEDVIVRELTSADTVRAVHDTLVCKATGNNISFTSPVQSTSYLWSTGATTAAIIAQDTGTYWCRAAQMCGQRMDTFHIRYGQQQVLSIKDTVNCQDQPVTIQPVNTYTSYLWSTGATTQGITVSQSGTYILTVSDTCGVQTDTVEVTIQPPTAPPVVRDTMICQGVENPVLNVEGTDLLWYRSNFNWGSPVQPTVNTITAGIEQFFVSQVSGKCESPKVPLTVNVKYKPAPNIGNYYFLCKDYDTLIGGVYPEVDYLWSTGDTICCIKPRYTGRYQLTISNECGTASDTAFVELSACDECMVVPNAFTPNNDGRNDLFRPIMKCPINNYHFQIFDRWGKQVFYSRNPDEGWNGRVKGVPVENGVYVFVLDYRSVNSGYAKQVKGNVALIR